MKKLLIFLFLAIAGICDTKAQYTIADNNHMTYRGVSLGLDISDFAKQLNAKGVSFGDEGFYDSGEFTDGSFEFQTLDVAYDQYEKRLKNVGVYWFIGCVRRRSLSGQAFTQTYNGRILMPCSTT